MYHVLPGIGKTLFFLLWALLLVAILAGCGAQTHTYRVVYVYGAGNIVYVNAASDVEIRENELTNEPNTPIEATIPLVP